MDYKMAQDARGMFDAFDYDKAGVIFLSDVMAAKKPMHHMFVSSCSESLDAWTKEGPLSFEEFVHVLYPRLNRGDVKRVAALAMPVVRVETPADPNILDTSDLRNLFEIYGAQADGYLSCTKLCDALVHCGLPLEELKAECWLHDEDNDGFLDFAGFAKFMTIAHPDAEQDTTSGRDKRSWKATWPDGFPDETHRELARDTTVNDTEKTQADSDMKRSAEDSIWRSPTLADVALRACKKHEHAASTCTGSLPLTARQGTAVHSTLRPTSASGKCQGGGNCWPLLEVQLNAPLHNNASRPSSAVSYATTSSKRNVSKGIKPLGMNSPCITSKGSSAPSTPQAQRVTKGCSANTKPSFFFGKDSTRSPEKAFPADERSVTCPLPRRTWHLSTHALAQPTSSAILPASTAVSHSDPLPRRNVGLLAVSKASKPSDTSSLSIASGSCSAPSTPTGCRTAWGHAKPQWHEELRSPVTGRTYSNRLFKRK